MNIVKTLTFIWLIIWLFLGAILLLETPRQIEKDRIFIEQNIRPFVKLVKEFKAQNHRLPTEQEFDLKSNKHDGSVVYIRQLSGVLTENRHKFKDVNWDNNFAIGVWRGEWEEYYLSWSDTYDSNNYSWKDGFMELIFCTCLGGLPLFFFWLAVRRRKRNNIYIGYIEKSGQSKV